MSLRARILMLGVAIPAFLIAGLLYMYSVKAKNEAVAASVDKARSICLSAESAREQTEKQWASGIFSAKQLHEWGERGEDDKVLSTVPVVTAWETAMAKASEGGYQFRVPAMEPRNPDNTPSDEQAEVLQRISREDLDEYHYVNNETNTVHYFRPVRLGDSCLNCHGDPASSMEIWGTSDGTDVTGHLMEGWTNGKMHGAFEVVQDLTAANQAATQSVFTALGVAGVGLVIITIVTLTMLKSLTKRIWSATRGIGTSIDGLREASDSMRERATDAATQSNLMSNAVVEMSDNLDHVTDAMGQIGDSIREIAARTNDTTRTADTAVTEANDASDTIERLCESSSRIDAVTQVINSLAEQTNLLALNATIEAARAGDYGKGFAVVASEVKDLANQTSKATEGIAEVIGAIRTDTTEAIQSVGRIREIISEIHEGQHTVSAAVNEQEAMTSEIVKSVQRISQASSAMSEQITGVAESSKLTSERVDDSASMISEIAKVSSELPSMVGIASAATST